MFSTGSPVDQGHRLASYDTSLVVSGGVDWWRRQQIVYDKKPQRYAKDNRTAHLTACSDKSVAYVTNSKRRYSVFCTVEANYWQTRSIMRPLCDSRATCLVPVFGADFWLRVSFALHLPYKSNYHNYSFLYYSSDALTLMTLCCVNMQYTVKRDEIHVLWICFMAFASFQHKRLNFHVKGVTKVVTSQSKWMWPSLADSYLRCIALALMICGFASRWIWCGFSVGC